MCRRGGGAREKAPEGGEEAERVSCQHTWEGGGKREIAPVAVVSCHHTWEGARGREGEERRVSSVAVVSC